MFGRPRIGSKAEMAEKSGQSGPQKTVATREKGGQGPKEQVQG